MKSVVIAVIIFILIIILITFSTIYADNVTGEVVNKLQEAEKSVYDENWQDAGDKIEYVREMWQKKRNVMVILFNHSMITDIDCSVVRVENTVKYRKKDMFFQENKSLSILVKNLKEQQEISLGNLF